MKTCSKCKEDLPTSSFHKATRSKDGLYCWCKECRRTYDISKAETRLPYHRNRYHKNKDEYLNSYYKRKYNISLQDYNDLLDKQGGVCGICKLSCSSGRSLAVDHNHSTGEVRGLLCGSCNMGIGSFKENIELLSEAQNYLLRKYV